MAQLNLPVDIADALQAALNAANVRACAEPLPRDFQDNLPITLVQPIGGGRSSVILDRFGVRLYTWASSEAAAITAAGAAMAVVVALEGQTAGGSQIYRVIPSALPYMAYDPQNPTIPRASQTFDVYARARTIDS